jgi:hypothetical protein
MLSSSGTQRYPWLYKQFGSSARESTTRGSAHLITPAHTPACGPANGPCARRRRSTRLVQVMLSKLAESMKDENVCQSLAGISTPGRESPLRLLFVGRRRRAARGGTAPGPDQRRSRTPRHHARGVVLDRTVPTRVSELRCDAVARTPRPHIAAADAVRMTAVHLRERRFLWRAGHSEAFEPGQLLRTG